MRKHLIKVGTEVMDKVTGQNLRITKVEDGIGFAYPILPGNESEDAPCLEITEDNCICFRFLRNPVKTTGIHASITDGKLAVNGDTVETGSIRPVGIIGTVPGKIVFTAKSAEDGKVDLMKYDVDRDRFARFAEALPEDSISAKQAGTPDAVENGEADLVILKTETVTETDEEGTEVEVDIDDMIYVINGKTEISRDCASKKILDTACRTSNDGNQCIYILLEGHSINTYSHSPFSEVMLYNGDDCSLKFGMAVPFVAERISAGAQGIAVFSKDCIAVKFHDREAVLRADDIWAHLDPDKKLPVPVDITVDGQTLTAVFADPETYETVQAKSVRTRDRGAIVTVQ